VDIEIKGQAPGVEVNPDAKKRNVQVREGEKKDQKKRGKSKDAPKRPVRSSGRREEGSHWSKTSEQRKGGVFRVRGRGRKRTH